MKFFKVFPVGFIELKGGKVFIKVLERYRNCLKGLDGFSHLIVLYWLHLRDNPVDRGTIQVYPKGDISKPLVGVFATRSPSRPNPIGLSVVRKLEIGEGYLRIDRIDAFNGTPVIDVKPYIKRSDCISDAEEPNWLRG